MMKVIFCLVAAFALAQATRDWSQIKPLDIYSDVMNIDINRNKNGQGRIVGGDEVKPHEIPYQVGLLVNMGSQTAFCGGSLISKKWVLTAAHCVEPAKSIEVVLGAHKIKEEEKTQVRLTSTSFVVHEKWSMLTLTNDIALIELPEEVELNENIQLSKLPKKSDVGKSYETYATTATGWGKDSDKSTTISESLRKVHLPVLKHSLCKIAYFGVIQDTHICTSSKGGKSTCSGDSGGPLVLEDSLTQVGLVSFGISFGCEIGWPAAYTRVTSYLDWISEKTGIEIEA